MKRIAEHRAKARWGQPLGRPQTAEIRSKLAKFLRDAADTIENDDAAVAPYAVALVLLGQADGGVGLSGFQFFDELLLAKNVLDEHYLSARWKRPRRNVVEMHTVRRFERKIEQRAMESSLPYRCEQCRTRFASERGLAQHARSRRHRRMMESCGGLIL